MEDAMKMKWTMKLVVVLGMFLVNNGVEAHGGKAHGIESSPLAPIEKEDEVKIAEEKEDGKPMKPSESESKALLGSFLDRGVEGISTSSTAPHCGNENHTSLEKRIEELEKALKEKTTKPSEPEKKDGKAEAKKDKAKAVDEDDDEEEDEDAEDKSASTDISVRLEGELEGMFANFKKRYEVSMFDEDGLTSKERKKRADKLVDRFAKAYFIEFNRALQGSILGLQGLSEKNNLGLQKQNITSKLEVIEDDLRMLDRKMHRTARSDTTKLKELGQQFTALTLEKRALKRLNRHIDKQIETVSSTLDPMKGLDPTTAGILSQIASLNGGELPLEVQSILQRGRMQQGQGNGLSLSLGNNMFGGNDFAFNWMGDGMGAGISGSVGNKYRSPFSGMDPFFANQPSNPFWDPANQGFSQFGI